MTRTKLITILVIVAALIGGGVWAWQAKDRVDPQVAKVEALTDKVFDPKNGMPDITKPEVREQFQELRKEVEAIPESERDDFMERQRERMQTRMEQQFDRYLAMSPEERTAELDKMIDQMESMRKAFENGDVPFGRRRGGDGAPGSDNNATGDNAAGGNGNGTAGGPTGDGNERGRPQFGPPWGGGRDPERMKEMRRGMLNATTPEFRAKASQFAKDMMNRMKERGITPPFPMSF